MMGQHRWALELVPLPRQCNKHAYPFICSASTRQDQHSWTDPAALTVSVLGMPDLRCSISSIPQDFGPKSFLANGNVRDRARHHPRAARPGQLPTETTAARPAPAKVLDLRPHPSPLIASARVDLHTHNGVVDPVVSLGTASPVPRRRRKHPAHPAAPALLANVPSAFLIQDHHHVRVRRCSWRCRHNRHSTG